jgi:hemolysin III
MLYRHLDHAAIFLMIAGTYTPFTVISFGGVHGRLLALIWVVALGVLFKLIAPRRAEPLSVPLYLIMGWTVLSDPGLLLSLPASAVTLLPQSMRQISLDSFGVYGPIALLMISHHHEA